MNSSASVTAEVPFGVVTVTSTVSGSSGLSSAGLMAVISVSDTTVTAVAAAPPKLTPVAPDRPVPVIVTSVPPAGLPLSGETPVTAGAGAR